MKASGGIRLAAIPPYELRWLSAGGCSDPLGTSIAVSCRGPPARHCRRCKLDHKHVAAPLVGACKPAQVKPAT